MAALFDFDDETSRFDAMRAKLASTFGPVSDDWRLDPLSCFVRSCLGAKTYDAVSWAAFFRLLAAFRDWNAVADARSEAVLLQIADVTYAPEKAERLVAALRMIRARRGELSLDFLADWPVEQAHVWLEALPNAGAKVAAATLNFSVLRMRSMVVDSHVLRVVKRLGLVAGTADFERAWTTLMEILPERWDADDLFRFHVWLKRLGQTLCRPEAPACGRCPLSDGCVHKRSL